MSLENWTFFAYILAAISMLALSRSDIGIGIVSVFVTVLVQLEFILKSIDIRSTIRLLFWPHDLYLHGMPFHVYLSDVLLHCKNQNVRLLGQVRQFFRVFQFLEFMVLYMYEEGGYR